jgi:hypothetical protein
VDERKVYGQYIVGQGKDFKVKPNKTHYGFDKMLISDRWYIVHITGKVLGNYDNETFASNLAKGLDKRDQLKLSEEIEKILLKSSETSEN